MTTPDNTLELTNAQNLSFENVIFKTSAKELKMPEETVSIEGIQLIHPD
ncbi:hypothetical protein [Formosa sp. S-31]